MSIFIKRLEKQTVHCGFTQIIWYSILHVLTGTYLCFYVHLADLSSVRYQTSTWNEIKELIKSNYLIIPSLLNKSQKNMTWNDRWETTLFLGGQGTARWNGSEITVKAGQAYPARFYYWIDYLKNESVSSSRIFCQIPWNSNRHFCMRNEQWISNENFSVLGQIEIFE